MPGVIGCQQQFQAGHLARFRLDGLVQTVVAEAGQAAMQKSEWHPVMCSKA
jgi:hypothetical protein